MFKPALVQFALVSPARTSPVRPVFFQHA